MLFNSDVFIFLFLPTTLCGFYALRQYASIRAAKLWLVAASTIFYGWWSPSYIVLLLASIGANFFISHQIARAIGHPRKWLTVGIVLNLLLLGYYKYADFFISNVAALTGTGWSVWEIILPIGISFFTFQQVAFLVDVSKKRAMKYDFFDYVLFVSFFPQLIAGPIVHHAEMMPQFERLQAKKAMLTDAAMGASIFFIGLFKKVIIADSVALYATPIFQAADGGASVGLAEAWQGALAYTAQIYFDFSGYSDMAIGLGLMVGIHLPINFNSPYKSRSIVEFWRRWHITLSRFLRDYLYIPLGGNRHGTLRRHLNLLVVMLLGGLWHGAAWTFVVWGGLHGLYLIINHAWGYVAHGSVLKGRAAAIAGVVLTFVAVVFAWVFFRAETFGGAIAVLTGMAGQSVSQLGLYDPNAIIWIGAALLLALFAPNTQEIVGYHGPAESDQMRQRAPERRSAFPWKPTVMWALVTAGIALVAIVNLWRTSEFLYFQF